MKAYRWMLLSGFLVWLAPFVAAMALASVRMSSRMLFEALMPVILSATAMVFLALRRRAIRSVRHGLALGSVWLAMSIALDLPMFIWGPMKVGFVEYMEDIGVTYLMYPVIAAGAGFIACAGRQEKTAAASDRAR